MKPSQSWQRIRQWRYWLAPGMGVKRYVAAAMLGAILMISGIIFFVLWMLQSNREVVSAPIESVLVSTSWSSYGGWISGTVAVIGLSIGILAGLLLNHSLLSKLSSHSRGAATVLHERLSLSRGPKIVALGGGTGLSNLLRGMRAYSSNITAVVAVSDDGGSSGRLRESFDIPPPGDLVDCLAALSDRESEVSRLLDYRFERGEELKGHTFGNLFITTLTEVEGDFAQAIRVMNALLDICGAVYPVSPAAMTLRVLKASGDWVEGESTVADFPGAAQEVVITPKNPELVEEVASAIQDADAIILGPGSVFTSILPPLLVPECKALLQKSKVPLIYICNVMTEAGETDHFSAWQHTKMIEKHLGRYPDWVMVNSTPIDEHRLLSYKSENADVVDFDIQPFQDAKVQVAYVDLLMEKGPFAQHDSNKLAKWIVDCARGKAKA